MLITFKDRLRPLFGPGGAKQISLEAILPMVLLPAMLCIAAINVYCTIIVCVAVPLILGYAQYVRRNYLPRTKFFIMWAIWSIVYLWILFEMTVPLTELLPEENFIFIATMFGSGICFYWVRRFRVRHSNNNNNNSTFHSDQNKSTNELCGVEY